MQCTHLDQIRPIEPSTPDGCEECLKTGSRWVQLRLCLTCGHVGCCDASPNKHATKHFHRTTHPIVRSYEPGEDWGWCYADRLMFEPAPRPDKGQPSKSPPSIGLVEKVLSVTSGADGNP